MNGPITGLIIISVIAVLCNGKISDQRLCGDADCSSPVSFARTLLRYASDDSRILAFPPGEVVKVFSKSAGSRPDLWGVEIGGKRGYAPKGLLREERVLVSKLDFLLPTEEENPSQYGIASSVAPTEANTADPTDSYEVAYGTTLFYDDMGTVSQVASIDSTALPVQATTSKPIQEIVEEHQDIDKQENEHQKVEKQENVEEQRMVEDKQEKVEEQPDKLEEHKENEDEYKEKVEEQEKVEEHHEMVEEQQEEGSAQRLYHYITSLLPTEGSGFLSSSEEQSDEIVESIPENSSLASEMQASAGEGMEDIQLNDEAESRDKVDEEQPESGESLDNSSENLVENSENDNVIPLDEEAKVPIEAEAGDLDKEKTDLPYVDSQQNNVDGQQNNVDSALADQGEETSTVTGDTFPETVTLPTYSIPVPASYFSPDSVSDHVSDTDPSTHTNLGHDTEAGNSDTEAGNSDTETGNSDTETGNSDIYPDTYPITFDNYSEEAVAVPHIELEKSVELVSSLTSNPIDDTLGSVPSTDEISSLPPTAQPTDDDNVGIPLDHIDDQFDIQNNDSHVNLPWDTTEEATNLPTTDQPIYDKQELADVATVVEDVEEVNSSAESSPGFIASFLNMFSGSSLPQPSEGVEDAEGLLEDDEVMQGDEPRPQYEDDNDVKIDVDKVKIDGWWAWNPSEIVRKGFPNEDPLFIEPAANYNGIHTIVITAIAVLVFTLCYYGMENYRRDSVYVCKINVLEKALHVSTTECLQLREEVEATSGQAGNLVQNDEEIAKLREELEIKRMMCKELDEQVMILNNELDTATETGMELNRMLGDYLADDKSTSALRASVDSLQEQLASQQTTINATNTLLFNKNMENDLFRSEITALLGQLELSRLELCQSTDECADLREAAKKQKDAWIKSHEVELTSKQAEVARLETCLWELEEKFQVSQEEVLTLQQCVEKTRDGDSLQELLDVARVNARLAASTKQCETLKEQLAEETGARKLLEDHVRVITKEIIVLRDGNALAEKEKAEAINKLTILKTYFEEKEALLQKDIDLHEALFKQKAGDAESMYKHLLTLQEQANHNKSQIEILKKEYDDQERSLKEQLYASDSRAHENWVAARQAERKCEELKQEAALLRNRLTVVETQLVKTAQVNEHPPMMNDRVPMEGNGDMHNSPLHMHYMDMSYGPRPYMPPPLFEPDQRLPPLGCLPTPPLLPPPAYSRPRHYEPGFRPLPPHNRSRRPGSNSSGHSSGSIEKPGSRKQFDS